MISESHCGLPVEIQEKLRSIFQGYPSIEKVVLYGSRAMSTHKPGSDVDLAIMSEKLGLEDLLRILDAIDDLLLPYKVDLSLLRLVDNPQLMDHVSKFGIQFYP